jgi:hypothetical protein
MAATTVFSIISSDMTDYQPDILGYGITDFDTQLQFAEDDVIRQIRAEWWERYRHTVRYKDITKVTTLELDSSKLTPAQFKRATIYKALAEYVYPQLTKWKDPQGGDGQDAFQVQMAHYRARYAEEFQEILKDGIEYDEDGDDTVTASEKEPIHHNRLVR